MKLWDEQGKQVQSTGLLERFYIQPGVRKNSFYVSDSDYKMDEPKSRERLRQILPYVEKNII